MTNPQPPTDPCPRCGTHHTTPHGNPACTSHAKTTGKPCHNPPMTGQAVCRMHGGSAAQNRRAAARRVAEQQAAHAVQTLGLPVDISPTEALLEEVRWTAGHVQWLRARVQELHPEHDRIESNLDGTGARPVSLDPDVGRHTLVWGTKQVVDKGSGENPGTDTTEAAGPSVWYELYSRERQHLVHVCAAALKAGVEERRVRLAESQGELVALVIRRILDAMYTALLGAGFTDAQVQAVWATAVADVVPRELRALAGSPT